MEEGDEYNAKPDENYVLKLVKECHHERISIGFKVVGEKFRLLVLKIG